MPKIIMTSDEYIRRLKVIAARPTYYSNRYPNNLCYIHKDGRTSADCWNLVKALLNGYDVNNLTVGYYQKDLSNTGDCTVDGLFKKCTDVSADFRKLKNGEPRLLGMPNHAGSYIGDTIINGKLYNVIESTGSWERKVLYSYVDESGYRYHFKGATRNGRWTKHGKMTAWLDYSAQSNQSSAPATPTTPAKTNLDIANEVLDGKWGNGIERKSRLTAAGYDYATIQGIVNELVHDKPVRAYHTVQKGETLGGICRAYGITQKYVLSLNPQIKNPNLIYPNQKIRIK